MQVTITSLHQQSHAYPTLPKKEYPDTKKNEEKMLDELLDRVSPEYLKKSGRTKADRQILSEIVPEIIKKPRKKETDENKALTLSCRRK